VHEPGTAFTALSENLVRINEDPKSSKLEVYLLSNKLDERGQKVMRDSMAAAEVRPIGIDVFDEETREFLKQQFDKSPVISVLVLWTRYGAGKLGILRMKPTENGAAFDGDDYEDWEGKAISAYLHRHNL